MIGGTTADRSGKTLWNRWWIRFPAYLVCAPVVIAVVDVLMAAAFTFFSDGYLGDMSEVLPPLSFLSLWAGGQMVPLLLPLVVIELGNRKRKSAVPPVLCALFVAVFTAALMASLMTVMLISSHIPNGYLFSNWQFGVLIILGSCIAGGACATALVSPLVRRWAERNASAKDLAEHF